MDSQYGEDEMARPPAEWPIPVYVTELRERVVATYRVPSRALASQVPAPVAPALRTGYALVSLCLSNGRCLKSVGGAPVLASEFHLAELVTPVTWQGACRPSQQGLFLLRLLTDSQSLGRLVRTALGGTVSSGDQEQGLERGRYTSCLEAGTDRRERAEIQLPRPLSEAGWPADSTFSSQEAAEALLLHPECYFVPDDHEDVLHAVPVHQYARATTHVCPWTISAPIVARSLRAHPEDVVLDHVLFQKRCTHTWFFPPERIPLTRRVRAFQPIRTGAAWSAQPVA
jgi:hypothetical protein